MSREPGDSCIFAVSALVGVSRLHAAAPKLSDLSPESARGARNFYHVTLTKHLNILATLTSISTNLEKVKANLDPEFFTKSELIQKQNEYNLTSSVEEKKLSLPSNIHNKEKTTSDLEYLSNLSKTVMDSAKTNLQKSSVF